MKQSIRERRIYHVTIVGGVVNFILLIIKFAAGIVGRSSAMIADAIHSLSDFVTDVIVIVFVRISSKPADGTHAYGHGKYETMATAVIGLILLGVGVGVFLEGVEKIWAVINGKVLQSPGMVAFIVAAVSIVLKELLYRYTVDRGRKLNSQAVIANAWHHRSDALSSIGTFVGIGCAIFGGEKWRVLDPVAAVVVSVFIVRVAVEVLKTSLAELLEHSLSDAIESEIKQIILSVEGVEAPHNLRTRCVGNNYVIDVHIRMDGSLTLAHAHNRTIVIEQLLRQRYGSETFVSIHVEPRR